MLPTPMTSDRFLAAFEGITTVVMLALWVAVAVVIDGALRADAPVRAPAEDAGVSSPVHEAASGPEVGPSGIARVRDAERDRGR
jgi:hypothetical protein